MSLVNGLHHQESLVAQWLKRPTGIWEAIGSIPVGTEHRFLLCPTFVASEHSIFIEKDDENENVDDDEKEEEEGVEEED